MSYTPSSLFFFKFPNCSLKSVIYPTVQGLVCVLHLLLCAETMELPKAKELELELEKELTALRKDPATYATYIRGNRQNLYKGKGLF
jgi:hypothetical protein